MPMVIDIRVLLSGVGAGALGVPVGLGLAEVVGVDALAVLFVALPSVVEASVMDKSVVDTVAVVLVAMAVAEDTLPKVADVGITESVVDAGAVDAVSVADVGNDSCAVVLATVAVAVLWLRPRWQWTLRLPARWM